MLPFVRVFKRKAHFKGDWGRVATTNLRTERFSVSPHVYLPDATLDRDASPLYNGLGMGRNPRSQRHRQTMNAPVGRNDVTAPIPVVSSTGMRKNAGIAAVAIFCFLLGVMFLIRVSDMTELSKSVSSLRASITRTQQENAELENQMAQLCSEVNVGYEAAKLGMISAKGVDVIYLIAPETRDSAAILSVEEEEVQPAHSEFFATLLGL